MDHRIIYYLALAAAIAFAFRFGGNVERKGALTALLGSVVSSVAANSESWAALDFGLLVIDIGVLASFWWLALSSDRFWPYWATGWQLVTVLIHVQRGLFEEIMPAPYALLSMYLAYPILLVIAAASLTQRRRDVRATS
jgi:hypothetical protein